jgi:hypothetical protein
MTQSSHAPMFFCYCCYYKALVFTYHLFFFLRISGHCYSVTHLRKPKILIIGSNVVKLNASTIGNCFSFPTFNELDWVDCLVSLLSDQDDYSIPSTIVYIVVLLTSLPLNLIARLDLRN